MISILTVGEGDLSLSLALVRAYGWRGQLELLATTLDSSKEDLLQVYPDADLGCLEESETHQLKFGIDACRINEEIPNRKFDVILFHHPHLGLGSLKESEQYHVDKHHQLLSHYFYAAKHSLRDDGSSKGLVHVCLCGTQPKSWRVMEAAQRQGLELVDQIESSRPFHMIWRSLEESEAQQPQPGHAAPRKFRNGKLGSRHWLGKYGYRHRRTEGKKYNGNSSDMNVSGSYHFVFASKGSSSDDHSLSIHSRDRTLPTNTCQICLASFESETALRNHLLQPALPSVEATTISSTERTPTGEDSQNSARPMVTGDDADEAESEKANDDSCVHEPMDKTLINREFSVTEEYDGTRLRLYLRKVVPKLSKRAAEQCVRTGSVYLNGKRVLDSGRVLKVSDSVVVVKSASLDQPASHESSKKDTIKILQRLNNMKILVVWKPPGMRSSGEFEGTLQHAVSQQEGKNYEVLSSLDSSCGGICSLIEKGTPDVAGKPNVTVQSIYTVLVHGTVPKEWVDRKVMKSIPIKKTWNKRKRENNEELSCSVDVDITCTERVSTPDLNLSTLCLAGSISGSGICSFLRKEGFPVVGDRFCRKEDLSLKRSIRNRMKNKLCLGCFALRLTSKDGNPITEISQPIPDKLSALHWKNFLHSDGS